MGDKSHFMHTGDTIRSRLAHPNTTEECPSPQFLLQGNAKSGTGLQKLWLPRGLSEQMSLSWLPHCTIETQQSLNVRGCKEQLKVVGGLLELAQGWLPLGERHSNVSPGGGRREKHTRNSSEGPKGHVSVSLYSAHSQNWHSLQAQGPEKQEACCGS